MRGASGQSCRLAAGKRLGSDYRPNPRYVLAMKVKRIVTNIHTLDVAAAKRFYGDVLGLDLLMDQGWIATYGSPAEMSLQISFAAQGGSDTTVPDISIEVDDLDAALLRVREAGFAVNMARPSSHGASGAFIRAIRSASSSTFSRTFSPHRVEMRAGSSGLQSGPGQGCSRSLRKLETTRRFWTLQDVSVQSRTSRSLP